MKNRWVLSALFAGIVASLLFSSTAALAQPKPQRIELTARRFVFSPAEITLKKGQPVVLILKSLDVGHGIRFRKLNIDLKVPAGGTAQVEFTPEKAGEFVGHCSVFCGAHHGSMVLRLRVVN